MRMEGENIYDYPQVNIIVGVHSLAFISEEGEKKFFFGFTFIALLHTHGGGW